MPLSIICCRLPPFDLLDAAEDVSDDAIAIINAEGAGRRRATAMHVAGDGIFIVGARATLRMPMFPMLCVALHHRRRETDAAMPLFGGGKDIVGTLLSIHTQTLFQRQWEPPASSSTLSSL